jgi:hypothetical protein
VNCTTAEGAYTVLHAAAAWGRLQCVGMLLRYGYAAGVLSAAGESLAALAALDHDQLPQQLDCDGIERPAGQERQKVVLLL